MPTSGELAIEYGFTDVDGSRLDAWRLMVDQEHGRAARPLSLMRHEARAQYVHDQ